MQKIDIKKCIFGHVPIGTGNDLANSMGYGGSVKVENNLKCIKNILTKYVEATYTTIDVWDLKLKLNKDKGEIIMINKDIKFSKKDNKGEAVTTYKRSFINYFSLGYDARVGFGFDKNRSKSRCLNKVIYFWEGLKKIICTRTFGLNSFLDSFYAIKDFDPEQIKQQKEKNLNNGDISNNMNMFSQCSIDSKKTELIFRSKSKIKKTMVDNEHTEGKCNYICLLIYFILDREVVLKGDPVCIVGQNINCYAGGSKDIWLKSGKRIGLEVRDENFNLDKQRSMSLNDITSKNQCFNDKKLECITYSHCLKLGLEKIVPGLADKVYHGPGPILIKFKETPERVRLH